MAHLNNELRIMIRDGLDKGRGVREIAESIGKDRTTVMREIARHSGGGCKAPSCARLQRAPHVCNGCDRLSACRLDKLLYIPDKAQKEYERTLRESREGVSLTKEELDHIGGILHEGVLKGQSIHHVMVSRADEFTVCEKTVYAFVNKGLLRTRRHHLPEAPSRPLPLKLRRSKRCQHKVDRQCREGRTLDDFQAFVKATPDVCVVEMDSVAGRAGGKVLLTLNIDSCGLMLAFIRDRNDAKSVAGVFATLEERLGRRMFRRIFGAVLTDNGSEFSNPAELEADGNGGKRTRVFYCDPYSAWQKPCVENNHRNLRKILGKGVSFDSLTQEKVNLVMSHVNSLLRKEYGDKSAASRFRDEFGGKALATLGIDEIPPADVCLKPSLVGLPE